MIDQVHLTFISEEAHKRGLRVLQGFRLRANDRDHMAALLEYMQPAQDTHWLDMGCGFGEPARLMQELRPDLTFTLVNNNFYQLAQVSDDMDRVYCDMHETPFEPNTFDGVMFLYSLCHADDFLGLLREAARVVVPQGRLFVFDYVRLGGNDLLTYEYLAARFLPMTVLTSFAQAGGWDFEGFVLPQGSDAVFRSLADNSIKLYEQMFRELQPIVWWAVKR